MIDVFAVQVFFIVFRECLEAVIVVSVLLSFLKQCLGQPGMDLEIHRRLRKQVWWGSLCGVVVCLIIGGIFIGIFYGLGSDIWSNSEDLWEGIFYVIATVIVTVMGLALLRINKTKQKWRVKIAQALIAKSEGRTRWLRGDWARRYAMFILPFITTMREGVEAVVFVGGVSLGYPATAFPLPVVTGLLAGLLAGWCIYRGGNVMSIRIFLIASTCVLYLIAAGMFSKAVWSLQFNAFQVKVGSDVAEEGSGPGSYNIAETVWHVNCCNPEIDNGWDVFQAILGWQNTGTYGSVISYNLYWVFIMACVSWLMYEERKGQRTLVHRYWSFLARIPGLKSYAAGKLLEMGDSKEQDLVRQVQASMFVDDVVQTVVEPTK
ncbi:plasma membrane iron permease [Aspergillus japonicus CBS 114.51]|uniref:Plasma membrane iron permease n=2 Tax=Aspergillus TaxID=5052 RepID=A0A2V5GPN0_ASPV1|nr:plasma membrane iron permease [Aspergillus japonicus CBS 114.51]PYI12979.1 plasma membrane iron permease [Aspergillus violaceofuscus CBS 115571]RAH76936.1 plasma membrane iron permease [Aspergillus japonicus CBS 114.51]